MPERIRITRKEMYEMLKDRIKFENAPQLLAPDGLPRFNRYMLLGEKEYELIDVKEPSL